MSNSLFQAILTSFENVAANSCLSTVTYKVFKVFDRKDNCCFICIENEPNSLRFFTVNNPDEKEVHFLAIDKCTINVDTEQKCDCAIFDDQSFYFIEMKTASSGQRGKRRTDAYDQLKSSISIFKEKIDFNGLEVFGLISFGNNYRIPKTNSSNMQRRKELSDLFNVKLVEGNEITL